MMMPQPSLLLPSPSPNKFNRRNLLFPSFLSSSPLLFLLLLLFACIACSSTEPATEEAAAADTGWWDGLKQSLNDGLNRGANFAHTVALPALSDTWESARKAVLDSGAHTWMKESALPAVQSGLDNVRSYIHEKTAPVEVDKAAEAAVAMGSAETD